MPVIRPSAGEMPERRKPDSLAAAGRRLAGPSPWLEPRQQLRPPVGPSARDDQPLGPAGGLSSWRITSRRTRAAVVVEDALPGIEGRGQGRRRRLAEPRPPDRSSKHAVDGVAPVGQLEPQPLGPGQSADQEIVVTEPERMQRQGAVPLSQQEGRQQAAVDGRGRCPSDPRAGRSPARSASPTRGRRARTAARRRTPGSAC